MHIRLAIIFILVVRVDVFRVSIHEQSVADFFHSIVDERARIDKLVGIAIPGGTDGFCGKFYGLGHSQITQKVPQKSRWKLEAS